MIDKMKNLRILTQEDVEYQEDKNKIKNEENRELIMKSNLTSINENYINLQKKFNILSKNYKNSINVNTLLLESLEDLATNIENIKKRPEKSQKFKFSNYSVCKATLNNMIQN